jgi:endonuclease YncB( thermonuclease family)
MIKTSIWYYLLVTAILFALPTSTNAATLQAKVVDVQSGNVLVVANINRQVRIKLKAIAAPEKGQPFSDTASDHLKLLVFGKAVTVDYTHLVDGFLIARVTFENRDIGAQMIRDGVAWYDRSSGFELSEADRDLYAQCEQAARDEHRGLWKDPSPVSPWDYRQAQIDKANAVYAIANPSATPRPRPLRRGGNSSALSSDDLLVATVGPGSLAGNPILKRISNDAAPGHWTKFESVNRHFTVLFPSDGMEVSYTVLDSQGKAADAQYLAGGDYATMYLLMSMKGDNDARTDASAAIETVNGFVAGINRHIAESGFAVSVKPSREVDINGYTGKQFVLSSALFSGTVRVVSKQIGDQREIFMLVVLRAPDDDSSGTQFLNSFKISPLVGTPAPPPVQ